MFEIWNLSKDCTYGLRLSPQVLPTVGVSWWEMTYKKKHILLPSKTKMSLKIPQFPKVLQTAYRVLEKFTFSSNLLTQNFVPIVLYLVHNNANKLNIRFKTHIYILTQYYFTFIYHLIKIDIYPLTMIFQLKLFKYWNNLV